MNNLNKEIELSSIEAAAYWWVNVIRNRVREIFLHMTTTGLVKERLFLEIFYDYTDVEWRNLYLELVKYITEDVNNYVPIGKVLGIDAFSQDTCPGGHKRINYALKKITGKKVPDIRLASYWEKDSAIYTNMFGASVCDTSYGVKELPTKYEESYILTGDEKKLNFYNLFILTMAVLKKMDRSFMSLPIFQKAFCEKYLETYENEDLDDVIRLFNDTFNKAIERKLVFVYVSGDKYSPMLVDIDTAGLQEYMDMAKDYAEMILKQYNYFRKTKNVVKVRKITKKALL